MPINLRCPTCSAAIAVPDDQAGRAVSCGECGERLRTTAPRRPEPPAEPKPENARRPPRPPAVAPPAPVAVSDEPDGCNTLLNLAATIRLMVTLFFAVVLVGCGALTLAGLSYKREGEALTVSVLAVTQAGFAVLGVNLVEQFCKVYVEKARDTRAVRKALCKE